MQIKGQMFSKKKKSVSPSFSYWILIITYVDTKKKNQRLRDHVTSQSRTSSKE